MLCDEWSSCCWCLVLFMAILADSEQVHGETRHSHRRESVTVPSTLYRPQRVLCKPVKSKQVRGQWWIGEKWSNVRAGPCFSAAGPVTAAGVSCSQHASSALSLVYAASSRCSPHHLRSANQRRQPSTSTFRISVPPRPNFLPASLLLCVCLSHHTRYCLILRYVACHFLDVSVYPLRPDRQQAITVTTITALVALIWSLQAVSERWTERPR